MASGRRSTRSIAALALALALPGCATYRGYSGPVENVLARDPARPTALDARLEREGEGQAPGESGASVIATGEDALLARLALTDLAGRSLDIQTYIWDLDRSGRIVLARVLAAADRGVRVRLLLDDTTTITSERTFATLDTHPNLDVRFFNPFRTRAGGTWAARGLEFLFDFARLNRRMHNKAWIADDGFAIVGGRNVSDEYSLISEERNFRDLDLMAAGEAAHRASEVFDRYWNSRWAVPAGHLARPDAAKLDALRERMAAFASREEDFPSSAGANAAEAAAVLERSAPIRTWAPVEVLADEPSKIEEHGTSSIAERLVAETARVERELRLEMAYLSLRRPALEQLAELVGRGVRVRVLTNALATTDVVFAHAGYVGTRKRLLVAGVELHELRPGGHERGRVLSPPLGSRASLHSKAAVFDERALFVGSLNLDPRSIRLNTEIGLLVESRELALEVARRFDAIASPESSWRVELRTRRVERNGAPFELRELAWVGRGSDGAERVWSHEPRAGLWRRSVARLLSWLPLEGLI